MKIGIYFHIAHYMTYLNLNLEILELCNDENNQEKKISSNHKYRYKSYLSNIKPQYKRTTNLVSLWEKKMIQNNRLVLLVIFCFSKFLWLSNIYSYLVCLDYSFKQPESHSITFVEERVYRQVEMSIQILCIACVSFELH